MQCLANPQYLNYLASQKIFDDPEFIAYLDYLQYFKEPKYARYLSYVARLALVAFDELTSRSYPGPTLRALELLQVERFRKDILIPEKWYSLWTEGVKASTIDR